jgi:hypothetical protein
MQRRAVLFQESKHWGTAGTAQRRWTQPFDRRLARAVKRSAPCAETDELRNKTSSVIKCLRHLSEPQMKSGSKKLKDQNRWQLWLFIAANAARVLIPLGVLNSSKIWKTPSWSPLSTKRFRQTVALRRPGRRRAAWRQVLKIAAKPICRSSAPCRPASSILALPSSSRPETALQERPSTAKLLVRLRVSQDPRRAHGGRAEIGGISTSKLTFVPLGCHNRDRRS